MGVPEITPVAATILDQVAQPLPPILYLHHRADAVELVEGGVRSATGGHLDRVFVKDIAALTLNFIHPRQLDPAFLFQDAQGVTGGDGAMLADVTRQQQPGILLPGDLKQLIHVRISHQPRFVYPNHAVFALFLKFSVMEQLGEGIGLFKTF